MIVFACLVPHPPIILPNVGSESDRAQVKKTIEALEKLGKELAKTKPDCIIISSPHPDWGIKVPWHFLSSKLKVQNEKLQFKMKNLQSVNQQLTIPTSSRLPGLASARPRAGGRGRVSNQQYAIYPILTALDSPKQHYQWGQEIARKFPNKLRLAWIASGDMSHRLAQDGPYGLHPSGPKFDQKFIELLKKKDVQGILNMNPRLIEEAGECGLRSFCMLLGALEWQSSSAVLKPRSAWRPEVISYEAPFGVGYLVTNFKLDKLNKTKKLKKKKLNPA